MALLVLGMLIYELERRCSAELVRCFTTVHFAAALLLMELFAVAYITEVTQISKRVLEIATQLKPKEIAIQYCGPPPGVTNRAPIGRSR